MSEAMAKVGFVVFAATRTESKVGGIHQPRKDAVDGEKNNFFSYCFLLPALNSCIYSSRAILL